MTEEKVTEVVEKPEGAGTETPPVETPKVESSQEVKTEQPVEEKPGAEKVDTVKLQEQVSNLNIALKQERESKKADSEAVKALEDKLASANGAIEKMNRLGELFNPTQETEEETPAVGMTEEQVEDFWNRKEGERSQKAKEEQQAEAIRSEITTMETEWDGVEGKPKYDDDEVVTWQKSNSKLHLTPKAAFLEMKHTDIIDYEVNQRLHKKPNVQNVETPGGTPGVREPQEVKPRDDMEIRAAVLEAMENSGAENNN